MTLEANSTQTLDKEMQRIEEALKVYESKAVGFPSLPQGLGPKVMEMSSAELRKKNPEDLAEYVLSLRAYSMFVQKCINEQKSWLNWANNKIDEVASIELPKIGPNFGWNERMLLAKHEHPLCKRLQSIVRESTLKIDRLSYMPNEIQKFADAVNDLRFTAIRKMNHQESQ